MKHTCTFDESGLCFECDAKEGAGDYAARMGTSVAEVSRQTGKPKQTVRNWHAENFDLFRVVVAGVVALKSDG